MTAIIDGDKVRLVNEKATLGRISVRKFKPKTAKKGKETTERKKKLQEAFVEQNKHRLPELQEKCKGKELSINSWQLVDKNVKLIIPYGNLKN